MKDVQKLLSQLEAEAIVITAFISPFCLERQMVRDRIAPSEFVKIFVDTPLFVAKGLNFKGLYAKSRLGHLKNFTGIDSPYEVTKTPEIQIDTTAMTIGEASDQFVK